MDKKNRESSFNININDNKIKYNEEGYKKLSNKDSIMFETIDPFGNRVVLWEYTFHLHILGEAGSHDSRHYLNNHNNIQRIQKAVSTPQFILEDKRDKDRLEYLSLSDIEQDGIIRLKKMSVIIEESKSVRNSLEIVTIVPKSRLKTKVSDRRVIYNVNEEPD